MTETEGSSAVAARKQNELMTEVKVFISRFTDDIEIANISSGDIIFPSNDASAQIEVTARDGNNNPVPGVTISISGRPETLTGPEWRTVDGLTARWKPDSAAKLRERISQGTVRLQSTFDTSARNTDGNGKAVFTIRPWHVCGGEQTPGSDLITLHYPNGQSDSFILKCGVPGLVEIPDASATGLAVKQGILGKYAHPSIVRVLQAVGDAWKRTGKPSGMLDYVTITEASLRWGGLIPPHLTHRFGGTADIRTISTDGSLTTVGAANYSREANAALIDYLTQTGASEIRFADMLRGVTVLDSTHSDHIHVSWLNAPLEPWFVKYQDAIAKLQNLTE